MGAPVFERMGLDHEVVMRRRTGGEAFDHAFEEFGHRGKGRMRLKRRVVFQLQQREVVGKPAMAHAQGGETPFDGLSGHQQQAAQVELEFLADAEGAVGAEIAVAAVRQKDEAVIERAVKDVLAHVAPMRGRQRQIAAGRAVSMSEFSSASRMSGTVMSIRRECPFEPPRS